MAEYQRGAHTVHDIKYHFVWVTKYRYPILTGEVALSAREYIRRICMEQEVIILEGSRWSRPYPSACLFPAKRCTGGPHAFHQG